MRSLSLKVIVCFVGRYLNIKWVRRVKGVGGFYSQRELIGWLVWKLDDSNALDVHYNTKCIISLRASSNIPSNQNSPPRSK